MHVTNVSLDSGALHSEKTSASQLLGNDTSFQRKFYILNIVK